LWSRRESTYGGSLTGKASEAPDWLRPGRTANEVSGEGGNRTPRKPKDNADLPTVTKCSPLATGKSKLANLGDANKREHEPETPRAALVRTLTEGISAATAGGDLVGARVVHEALGKLLDEPEPGNAKVVDITSHPSRRGGAR